MYCLDTNILIFLIKGENSTLTNKFLEQVLADNVFTTSICAGEFLYYSYKNKATKSLTHRKQLLEQIAIKDFDYRAADIFAQNKTILESKGLKIDDMDLLISSVAVANNLILVTNNTKHFENIPNLMTEDWTKLN